MITYDKTSIQINRCKRILDMVDDYVDCPTQDYRTALRKALMEEFEAPAIAPPVAAGSVDIDIGDPFLLVLQSYGLNFGKPMDAPHRTNLIAFINAWGAQQRDAEKLKVEQSVVLAVDQAHQQAKDAKDLANELRQRAEKAEAEVEFMKQVGMKEVEQANNVHARNVELEARVKELQEALDVAMLVVSLHAQ